MNAFMQLVLFLMTIMSAIGQAAAAPIPSAAVAQLDEIPIQRINSPFFPHNPEHGAKYQNIATSVYTPATATSSPTPSLVPMYEQTGNDYGGNSTWASTHTTALVVLLTLLPFVVCIVLYPIFKWFALRKEARLAKKCATKVIPKAPDSPTSPYINNPRLEPIPAHPEMVYIPPTAKGGTSPIFGHFRSPSGHVYGVTDRWVMASGAHVCGVHSDDLGRDSRSLLVLPL